MRKKAEIKIRKRARSRLRLYEDFLGPLGQRNALRVSQKPHFWLSGVNFCCVLSGRWKLYLYLVSEMKADADAQMTGCWAEVNGEVKYWNVRTKDMLNEMCCLICCLMMRVNEGESC